MTFLSVYTPTYKRPFMLELCKASVWSQTVPVEHVIVEDKVGIGISGVYADVRNHVDKVHGDYVMVLSDDNILVDSDCAQDLQDIVVETESPDVVVFKGQIEGTTQPAAWACEPRETMIDLSCFAVKRDIWVEHSDLWGERYEGDFDFIHGLWDLAYGFCWWDRLMFRALQISRGRPE